MSVHNKNSNWLGWRIFDVLSPQIKKIKDVIYNQWLSTGGWEGWAQFELAYGLDKYMRALAEAKSVGGDECLYTLAREEQYPKTNQRFDFCLSGQLTTALQLQHADRLPNEPWTRDPRSRSEEHYFELKCQGGYESMDDFVNRVNEDIDKIRRLDPQDLRGRGGTHLSVWMIAITTSRLWAPPGSSPGRSFHCRVLDSRRYGLIVFRLRGNRATRRFSVFVFRLA